MAHPLRWSCVILALVLVGGTWRPAAAAQEAPTFTKDVAPIFFKNCVVCHKPGESTPMSLLSYDTARPWARSIKRRVVAREMPPWFADPQYGHFSNDRRLTQQEIDTIAGWVDAGAPKGRPEDMPPAPTFAKGWRHPNGTPPDAIIEMPIEFKVAAGVGEITNTSYYSPIPFAEDKFVEATQVRPSNHAFVHHSVVRARRIPSEAKVSPETGLLVDARTGRPFGELEREEGVNEERPAAEPRRPEFDRQAQDVFDNTANIWVGTYAPGWDFERYKPGIGKRVPAGWHIAFNQHYQATGKAESDRTSLALWFQKVPTKAELVTRRIGDTHIVEGKQLLDTPGAGAASGNRQRIPNIPPFAEDWSIIAITPVLEPIAVYSWNPHMHLRGRDMKYVVVYPDGQEETLFSVPKYDFNWQLSYENSEPNRIPAGSKIMAVGHMDNSVKNKLNPAPDKEVFWSEQSWDEMFQGFFQFTKDTDRQKAQPKAKSTSKAKPQSTISQR